MFVSAFRKLIPSTSRSQQTLLVQPFKAEKSLQYSAPKKLLDEVVGYYHKQEKLEQNPKSIFVRAKSLLTNTWKNLTGKSTEEPFNELIVDQRGNYAFAMAQRKEFLPIEEASDFIIGLRDRGIIDISSRKINQEFVKAVKKANSNEEFEFNGQKVTLNQEELKKAQMIPSDPYKTYKDKGWNGLGDFLGTNTVANQNKELLPLEETTDFIIELRDKEIVDISSESIYTDFVKAVQWANPNESFEFNGQKVTLNQEELEKAQILRASPDRSYKDKGWNDFGDFLGTGNIATYDKEFLPIKEASDFIIGLRDKGIVDISSQTIFRSFLKAVQRANPNESFEFSGQTITFSEEELKKAQMIPSSPLHTYKDEGLKSIGDLLGTRNIATRNREFLLFEDAKRFIGELRDRGIDLSSRKINQEFVKAVKKANSNEEFEFNGQKVTLNQEELKKAQMIPAHPDKCYKKHGWVSIYDYLGKEKKTEKIFDSIS